eukprot:IDg1207t1
MSTVRNKSSLPSRCEPTSRLLIVLAQHINLGSKSPLIVEEPVFDLQNGGNRVGRLDKLAGGWREIAEHRSMARERSNSAHLHGTAINSIKSSPFPSSGDTQNDIAKVSK